MKKSLFFAVAATVLAGCASDELVDVSIPNTGSLNSDIRFTTNQKNMTRSWTELQKAGHYNFGVFAYKSTDKVNPVMPNYLVGYYDVEKGYGAQAGSTFGDQNGVEDGKSYWMYEGMGSAEYNGSYAGGALTPAYTSNNANQYLKYWDNSAEATYFYAYAPYINGEGTATYVDGTAQAATGADTYVLTIPNGTLVDGYDDESLAEYMYASAKVEKANYGHDVALQFQRLNAKVNIKFWEDIPGWKVRILNLQEGKHEGVQATASIKDSEDYVEKTYGPYGYRNGKYYTKNGVKIKFNDGSKSGMKQYEGTIADNTTPLVFKSPTDAQIGENRYAASPSETTYYAIPKYSSEGVLADGNSDFAIDVPCEKDLAVTGFTFHVSYELTAEDTGEHIKVSNATVHVPAEYCGWKENTHYTYIFKITKNTNGTTVDPTDPSNPDVDPTDPEVPTVQSLYPIVFDNCTVVDWDENVSEWEITEGTTLAYHDVQLSTYSLVSGEITVTVTDHDTHAGHSINLANVSVSGPDMTNVTYDGAGTINVETGAAAGVYTVTYTCDATAYTNHPKTWTEKFVVGNEYTITTHRDVIGTNWSNDATEAKLNISGTKDGNSETLTSDNLSIDYPVNFTDAQKAAVSISGTDVVVKKDAAPGVYKVVYTIDEGSKVKVAEKLFTVVDYSLTLSHTTVYNTVGGTVVTGNQVADADHVYTSTTGSVSDNAITVANNTDEGTYTVTYTVFEGAADETVYTQTFEVKNQYAVALNKTSVDRNTGTTNAGDTSSDYITVTLKKNGEATTSDLTSSLVAVKADGSTVAAGSIYFQYDGGAAGLDTYYLRVTNNVPAGNYKVVYTGQTDVTVEAGFVVTE